MTHITIVRPSPLGARLLRAGREGVCLTVLICGVVGLSACGQSEEKQPAPPPPAAAAAPPVAAPVPPPSQADADLPVPAVDASGEYAYSSSDCCEGVLDIQQRDSSTVSLQITTVTKEDRHTCNLGTESAPLMSAANGTGKIEWSPDGARCRIHMDIGASRIHVAATGEDCATLCQTGVEFTGDYARK